MRNVIFVLLTILAGAVGAAERPNIIVVLTDDQGYGDLSLTGNAVVRTPHLDSLARDGAWVKNFYVSPVCSPTRSSFLTGRYYYRTGVVDTYIGRSMMHADETTLAEILKDAGYRTGIFGKWHLGDNYPLRAMDQGFEESLVLKGGGIGQPSDPPGGEHYQNPMLLHNGELKKFQGYCSDVYTDHALQFIEKNRASPFFVYLPFNAPHGPLETPEKEWQEYKEKDATAGQPAHGFQFKKTDADSARKVYAMVANIDTNVGRVLKKLDDMKLAENTIVVFFTDNGAQQPRYNAGLRGLKGSVYEGGVRVPFFLRWKGKIEAGRTLAAPCAHIDLAPTLLDACGVAWPEKVKRDGRSFWNALTRNDELPDRSLFIQWHRGEEPEPLRSFAVRTNQWKLVQAAGVQEKQKFEAKYELFDIAADPYEQNDLAAQKPEIVSKLKAEHEAWHGEMRATRNYARPNIVLDDARENPVVLTKQDWRGPRANWGGDGLGHWDVVVQTPGDFKVTVHFPPRSGKLVVGLGGVRAEMMLEEGPTSGTVQLANVPQGPSRVEAWIEKDNKQFGVKHVHVERLKR